MDFRYDDDRQALADLLRRYLAERYAFKERMDAAHAGRHWAVLAELGVIGALFDGKAGGLGGGGFDIAVIFEQLGRHLVTEPFLGTLMAGRALGPALPGSVISGHQILTFAHQEARDFYTDRVATHAESRAGTWMLTGAKAVVPMLGAADLILVTARTTAGLSLFHVAKDAPGLTKHCYQLIDGGEAGELMLADTPGWLVAADAAPLVEDAVTAGIIALCWEAVGIMDVMRDSTIDYMRTRRQFGAAIGTFQALRHRMATVALEIEQARSAAINASAALDAERAARACAVSAAKYTIGRVGTLVAEECIQIHGGIGMSQELPLSHYAKRLTMLGHQLGDEDHHLQRFIASSAAA